MSCSSPGFVTWQPVLTDHQAYTYLSLQEESGLPVLSFVTAAEDAVRKAQGWEEVRVDALERVLVPQRGLLSFCFRRLREYRNAVHIFASPFQQPRLMVVLLLAVWMGRDVFLISEPYSPIGAAYYGEGSRWAAWIKSKVRPILYRIYVHLLGRRLAGIFAISRLAELQYRRAGIPSQKLMPFGYFVPRQSPPSIAANPASRPWPVRLIFVGSLIRRKGIDLLVGAMGELVRRGVQCTLDVYGPGDVGQIVESHALRYCGTIPFGTTQAVIAEYDLLVLPSRHDGWGVVVNEALCAGVPVLCSDAAGAGYAAAALGAGHLFVSDSLESLVQELEMLVTRRDRLQALKAVTHAAATSLQPVVAARYMLACMRAPQMIRSSMPAPWYAGQG